MLKFAQQGKRVRRLKGGDPFIFSRGGEELELLAEHDIRFEVVAGTQPATASAVNHRRGGETARQAGVV